MAYQPIQSPPVDFTPISNFLALRQQLGTQSLAPVKQQYANLAPQPAAQPVLSPNMAASNGGIGAAAQAAYKAGFRGNALLNAVAIAQAESGFNTNAHNTNAGTGDNSYGLFQINMLGNMGPARLKQYGLANNDALFDPYNNANAAYKLSGGGANFSPWTTFTSGKYKNYLTSANQFLSSNGYLTGPGPKAIPLN